MVSQLTCCSLVSVMVRVSVSRLFFRLRRQRLFAHPPAGKTKQGAEQQKRQVRHSRYHRQHEHNPGGGVEHRRACQQLVTHVMGDIAVVADAGDDNRRRGGEQQEGICATVPSPMVISTYCWKAASALRLC